MERTRRQQLDHDRYMRDRERRLAMQREWDKAHPDYHKKWYQKQAGKEIARQKYLRDSNKKIMELQTKYA